jgi:protein-disulfide isomerase
MFNRVRLRCWVLLALVLLAACGGQPTPASPAPTAAAPPTRAPASATAVATIAPTSSTSSGQGAATAQAPTAAPTASAAQPENATASIPDGLTPEGYHILGRADAPVTLVMYSDFL